MNQYPEEHLQPGAAVELVAMVRYVHNSSPKSRPAVVVVPRISPVKAAALFDTYGRVADRGQSVHLKDASPPKIDLVCGS